MCMLDVRDKMNADISAMALPLSYAEQRWRGSRKSPSHAEQTLLKPNSPLISQPELGLQLKESAPIFFLIEETMFFPTRSGKVFPNCMKHLELFFSNSIGERGGEKKKSHTTTGKELHVRQQFTRQQSSAKAHYKICTVNRSINFVKHEISIHRKYFAPSIPHMFTFFIPFWREIYHSGVRGPLLFFFSSNKTPQPTFLYAFPHLLLVSFLQFPNWCSSSSKTLFPPSFLASLHIHRYIFAKSSYS